MYKEIGKSKYYTSKFAKYDRGNLKDGVGTFYIAKLVNGDKIPILIDDRTVTIPKSGVVELPVASTKPVNTMELEEKLEVLPLYYRFCLHIWKKWGKRNRTTIKKENRNYGKYGKYGSI